MDLVIDLRLNGGTGGGGVSDSVSRASSLVTLVNSSNPWIKTAAAVIGMFGSKLDGSEELKQAELTQPNSLTNKALKVQQDANVLVGTINYSLNPAPNPAVNGPAPLMFGDLYSILPFIGTAADAALLIDPLKEGYQVAAEAKAEFTPMAILRRKAEEVAKMIGSEVSQTGKELKDAYEARMQVPNPSTGADESTQIYNVQTHIAAMQPQSVQIVTQQPAVNSAAPEQTINFNIQNDFNGNWQDRRGLEDIGEYLAQQVKDKLNSGARLYSNNW